MGKGEIACNEQFPLFPQCFQKACFPGASKGVVVWEWVKEDIVRSLGRLVVCWLLCLTPFQHYFNFESAL